MDEGDRTGELDSWGGSEYLGIVGTALHQVRTFAYSQGEECGPYRKTVSLWCQGMVDQSQEL